MNAFGHKFRLRREQLHKSMKDLAELLDMSIVHVSDIELGRVDELTDEEQEKIAVFLEMPLFCLKTIMQRC